MALVLLCVTVKQQVFISFCITASSALRVAGVYAGCLGGEQVLHPGEVDSSSPGSKYS